MYTTYQTKPRTWGVLLALALGFTSTAVWADQDNGSDPPDRVARLSFIRGNVSFQPAGDDQWAEVSVNRPLSTGDKLYTDKDARAELEIGAADIRLYESSTFNLLNLDDAAAQMELTDGTLNLHVRRVLDGQSYEVDTPTLAFVINRPGNYRIDIGPQGNSTMVTVFDGGGDVYGENNASYSVQAGNSYRFNDSALHDYEVLDLPRGDEFDQWCNQRNQRYTRAVSRQYVSEDVIGYADLDDYGGWNDEPEYGHVWYPTTVEAGWEPYRSGHWSWVDPWGWSWIDSSPWGFAPFHYGRWAYIGNRWGWCPGDYRARPIYAPALVAFVGGGGWGSGVSVGIGGGPVGWFPLGPRDVYVPWYHASRSYFTNVNVYNTRFINNTYITNVYGNYSRGQPITGVNYAYRSNLTAVSRDAFVGGRPVAGARVQINDRQLRNTQIVSRVGIAPTQASFVSSAGRSRAAPPAVALNRRVIARTAPPAQAAPLASRIQAIQRNGARPLAINPSSANAARPGVNNSAAIARPAASRVQVVGANAATKPQPLPPRGAANAVGQRPAIGNDRTATVPSRNAPSAAPNNAVRAPVAAPGNAVQNNTQRTLPNAGAQDRTALPSSRFAPHTRSTTDNSPNAVSRGANGAAVDRSNPMRGNAQGPNQSRTVQQPTNPATRSTPSAAPQSQIRPAAPLREIPRSNAAQPPAQPRTAPQYQAPQQRNVQPRNAPQQTYQPRVEQQRTAPVQQIQREAPAQRNVPQQQYQQPRSVPQQQIQRAAPQQQQQIQRAAPQQQIQRAAPQQQQIQQRNNPPPAQRAQPQQDQGRQDRGKDKDGR